MFEPIPVKRKSLETDVETHLVRRVKAIGGECYKWSSKNVRGVPDRICVFPDGTVCFVELKRDKSGRLSSLQQRFIQRMHKLQMKEMYVLHGKSQVDEWVDNMEWQHATPE